MPKRFRDQEFLAKIGTRIKSIRNSRSLSIEDVYSKCEGMNGSTLSRIERGLTDPQISTLKRIADALGVPVSELLTFGPSASGEQSNPAVAN